MFQDIEFKEACEELDVPNVVNWELFVETHGVKIYRFYMEVKYICSIIAHIV